MRCLPFVFGVIALLLFGANLQPNDVPYGTGTWDAAVLGNHRAVIHVSERDDVVTVHIPWRRRDSDPQKKNVIVIDAATGDQLLNLYVVEINRQFGNFVFRPHTVPGDYYVYYMPYVTKGSKHYPTVVYREPEQTAAERWLKHHGLDRGKLTKAGWEALGAKYPQAEVREIQSIDAFNSFFPMEVTASEAEVKQLLAAHAGKDYLLFPEDRSNPIRMTDDLPYKWIKSGVQTVFEGTAARGEFYAFQVGVFAVKRSIQDIDARFTALRRQGGEEGAEAEIPSEAFKCINLGGTDWTGKDFKKSYPVEKGKIQPLWCDVQVPVDLLPGEYRGNVVVQPSGMDAQSIELRLTVTEEVLADAGDSEPWRHSRLRWLDSRIALDDEIVPPFTEVKSKWHRHNLEVSCLGRELCVDSSGFPTGIHSFFSSGVTHIQEGKGREILASPVRLLVETADRIGLSWKAKSGKVRVTRRAPGAVEWEAESTAASGVLTMVCKGRMEMDGFVEYKVTLRASGEMAVKDIRLEIPIAKEVARYMMGLGQKGGFRPPEYRWKWDVKKNQDSAWIGDVNAGLQYSLRDTNYSRPLNTNFYQLKPLKMPVSWYNEGKGGTDIVEMGEGVVLVRAYSGERTMKAGEELHFNFNLLITPFKTLDTAGQWEHRFFHRFEPLDKIAAAGANTVNVHHATEINPYINYPFIRPKEMKAYIDEAHQMGLKVKIYYTVRELSNIAPELFALRSLGDEVLSYGPGGGFAWLQEHLGGNYIAGWFVPEYKDAAIINSGVSRWHNYYLEGLDWLVKNVGIDGLYIDDVAFDRTVMKRVRKILDRGREGALIDLHSANQFNPRDGYANSANLYLEHFPYLNRLWFGEYFDYGSRPDFWLVEISGIPFGLMGEMLQDGGNPWRGMVYGMTNRLPWAGDPSPLWKAWDEFGIKESEMRGFWDMECPVRVNNADVLATVYMVEGKRAMIALASWADGDVKCKLNINWKILGLDIKKVKLIAPAIVNFQPAMEFNPDEEISIPKGKGWLLILK
jgi:hypothetical protein